MVKTSPSITHQMVENFLQRLVIEPSGHWNVGKDLGGWGYAPMIYCGASVEVCAHVAAHLIYLGPIPGGYEVDHLCRLRWCVCPFHLQAMTHAQNIRQARGRECKRGHDLIDKANVLTYMKNGRLARMCKPCNDLRNSKRIRS